MRVDDPAQLDEPVHRTIRDDGAHVARAGADPLHHRFSDLLARLTHRLADEPADRLMATSIPGIPARLDDFLVNRTIEMAVHADDLARSAGLPTVDLPPEVAAQAIAGLVAITRHRLGDLVVLRALAGRDHEALNALRVL